MQQVVHDASWDYVMEKQKSDFESIIVACGIMGWLIVCALLSIIWAIVVYRGSYGTSGWTPFVKAHIWLSWFVMIPSMVAASIVGIVFLKYLIKKSEFVYSLSVAMFVGFTIICILALAEKHREISDCHYAMQCFADFLTKIDEFVGYDEIRFVTQGYGYSYENIDRDDDVTEELQLASVITSCGTLVVERLSEHSKFRLTPRPDRKIGCPRPQKPEDVEYIVAIERDRRSDSLAPGYYWKEGHGTWYEMFRINIIDWKNQKIIAGALFQFEHGNEPWSKVEQWISKSRSNGED